MNKAFLFPSESKQIHLGLIWLVLVVISLFSRSYLPIDETRYVTVAWNMYLNHDYLVPYLNGETYSHKPPLLFWLMNVGWQIFGVNDWWPRLLPSLFAVGALLLTQKIALRLWPSMTHVAYVSSLVLLGSGMWAVFTTATMFDMLVAFFTVLGAWGLLVAWQGEVKRGWFYVTLAIAGGLLAKGPTILLQVLPLAVLMPWWAAKGWAGASATQKNLKAWYGALLLALLLGVLILLAWAIPAGFAGGPKYQHEIFWGQTADRMVKSFAHRRPIYWYLPMLPVMLFPWLFALPVWRAISKACGSIQEPGVRFCLAWFVPVFIAFSFISGKQPHYLLPIIPAFALLLARGWEELHDIHWWDRLLPAFAGLLVGAVLLYLPTYHQHHYLAPWVVNIPIYAGMVMIFGSVFLMLVGKHKNQFIESMALLGVLAVIVLYLGVIRAAGSAYDVTKISQQLKVLQDQNIPLANIGKYHGQFNFLGRLEKSPVELAEGQLDDWFAAHPDGRVIMYFDKTRPLGDLAPEYSQPYRALIAGVLTRAQWQTWSKQPHVPLVVESDVNE